MRVLDRKAGRRAEQKGDRTRCVRSGECVFLPYELVNRSTKVTQGRGRKRGIQESSRHEKNTEWPHTRWGRKNIRERRTMVERERHARLPENQSPWSRQRGRRKEARATERARTNARKMVALVSEWEQTLQDTEKWQKNAWTRIKDLTSLK